MATNHETEFKQMIITSIYSKLQERYFKDSVFSKQVSCYIDIPSFKLKEHHSALRIRVKDNQHEMTSKTPAKVGLLEYDYIVDTKPKMNLIISSDNLPDDIRQIIAEQFGVKDTTLSILGASATYCQGAKYKGDLLILDKSGCFGTTGHELESEVKNYNQGLQEFRPLLSELNLKHHQPLNKAQHFFKKRGILSNNIN